MAGKGKGDLGFGKLVAMAVERAGRAVMVADPAARFQAIGGPAGLVAGQPPAREPFTTERALNFAVRRGSFLPGFRLLFLCAHDREKLERRVGGRNGLPLWTKQRRE